MYRIKIEEWKSYESVSDWVVLQTLQITESVECFL